MRQLQDGREEETRISVSQLECAHVRHLGLSSGPSRTTVTRSGAS